MQRLFKYPSVFSIFACLLAILIGQQLYAARKNVVRLNKTSEAMSRTGRFGQRNTNGMCRVLLGIQAGQHSC
jgi:hypothetical protein